MQTVDRLFLSTLFVSYQPQFRLATSQRVTAWRAAFVGRTKFSACNFPNVSGVKAEHNYSQI
jgi:hypothetical protein